MHEALGMSPMSFEEDLATCGSEVGTTVVNGGRRHEAQSRVPVRVVVVVVAEIAAEQATVFSRQPKRLGNSGQYFIVLNWDSE